MMIMMIIQEHFYLIKSHIDCLFGIILKTFLVNSKLGSCKFKELLPDLKFEDEPVEVEVTVKIIKK